MRPLRVMVVDDSALMRRYLRQILEDGGMEVVLARDGQDALDRVDTIDPDVVTLDINMPHMDGLTCLNHMMIRAPRPVVMISSLTEQGALATLEALELGALDYIPKPGGTVSHNIRQVSAEIIAKVEAAARTQRRAPAARRPKPVSPRPARQERPRPVRRRPSSDTALVLIGASTGGPAVLSSILDDLPADFPAPILIAQHMPAHFTRVFAQRLQQHCALDVQEVSRSSPLVPGQVLIAQGDHDVLIERRLGRPVAVSVPPDSGLLWHPSVDRMVASACAVISPTRLIAVQLTGMGNDGAQAMAELHSLGGQTIAESEETAVVYGMPRELVEAGGATKVLPADQIAERLCAWTRRRRVSA